MKILIVDDNEKSLKLFKVIVESMGCEALAASGAEKGIELAKTELPDLILMDIQMPRMDGITALKLLKRDGTTKNIPVIAVTSYAMESDKKRFLNEGFVDYIPKPINADGFKEVIKKYLEG